MTQTSNKYPQLLFTPKTRTDPGVLRVGESGYSFLDRVIKDGSDERRAQANALFEQYPEGDAKYKLWRQISSKDETAFDEMFFELVTYAHLKKSGISIENIEPTVLNGKAPDFLCSFAGQKFYVEVVTVHDLPMHKRCLARLQGELQHLLKYRYIGALKVKRHSDNVRLNEQEVKRQLKHLINKHRSESEFSTEFVQTGWQMEFICTKSDKDTDSFLSSIMYAGHITNTRDRIVAAVREKSQRYGVLSHPLVIFLNINGSIFPRLETAVDAMYGQQGVSYSYSPSGVPDFLGGKAIRQPNGACHLSFRTDNLESVIFFEGAGGNRLGRVEHLRVVNPNCKSALKGIFPLEPTVSVSTLSMKIVASQVLGHELSSDQSWFYELIES